jgi:D-3-phosphoglycerate dehydrogenase
MGLSFAKKLSGFDVNVIAYDKYKTNFSSDIVTQVSLSELQERSDIVSLHTPLTQETIGLIDYSFLNSFKKSIILINSARGRSVVLKDVLKALDSKKLIGACLDVLELESSSFEVLKGDNTIINELLKRQNIIFTPHIAGWSDEAKIKMAEVLIEKIAIFSQQ